MLCIILESARVPNTGWRRFDIQQTREPTIAIHILEMIFYEKSDHGNSIDFACG